MKVKEGRWVGRVSPFKKDYLSHRGMTWRNIQSDLITKTNQFESYDRYSGRKGTDHPPSPGYVELLIPSKTFQIKLLKMSTIP